MAKADFNVQGGRIFYKGELIEAGIAVQDGKIIKVAKSASLPTAGETVNAKGLVILPGVIDVHVHVRDMSQKTKEDWTTASHAAAAGGITTILAMPNTSPPITTARALKQYKTIARKKSVVDYGVFIGATETNTRELTTSESCGIKLAMGSTTGNLLVEKTEKMRSILETSVKAGKTVVVHAEDEEMIKKRFLALKKRGREPPPKIHSVIRDPEAARIAVSRAIRLSKQTNAKIHIAHVSTRGELIEIVNAKKDGLLVSCEVTPHHLFLSEKDYDAKSHKLKVNPPLRSRSDVSAAWGALLEGIIDCVATDHAPHVLEDKEQDYWSAPSGLPGLETMLPLMLDSVNKSMLSLAHVADLLCTNPAKIFRLKNKGKIMEGFDADLTFVDLKREWKIRGDEFKTRCGWTPFEGRIVSGKPVKTMIRGAIVFEDGDVVGGRGREVQFK